jgi:hypothetical protein
MKLFFMLLIFSLISCTPIKCGSAGSCGCKGIFCLIPMCIGTPECFEPQKDRD